jgi:hypothetical protein
MSNEDNILWIKLHGPRLDKKAVPIYELGELFVAIQTILNKVYWYENQQSQKKRFGLSKNQRTQLALSIKTRKFGSDEYGLTPFLSNPYVIGIISGVVSSAIVALATYTLKKIIRKREENDDDNRLIGLIYPQVDIISKDIGNIGGIEKIEITSQDDEQSVVFDKSVREYVKEIGSEPLYGKLTQITGFIDRLNVRDSIVRIRTEEGYVRVLVSWEDFNKARYQAANTPEITFEGRYIYYLDRENSRFEDFNADRII